MSAYDSRASCEPDHVPNAIQPAVAASAPTRRSRRQAFNEEQVQQWLLMACRQLRQQPIGPASAYAAPVLAPSQACVASPGLNVPLPIPSLPNDWIIPQLASGTRPLPVIDANFHVGTPIRIPLDLVARYALQDFLELNVQLAQRVKSTAKAILRSCKRRKTAAVASHKRKAHPRYRIRSEESLAIRNQTLDREAEWYQPVVSLKPQDSASIRMIERQGWPAEVTVIGGPTIPRDATREVLHTMFSKRGSRVRINRENVHIEVAWDGQPNLAGMIGTIYVDLARIGIDRFRHHVLIVVHRSELIRWHCHVLVNRTRDDGASYHAFGLARILDLEHSLYDEICLKNPRSAIALTAQSQRSGNSERLLASSEPMAWMRYPDRRPDEVVPTCGPEATARIVKDGALYSRPECGSGIAVVENYRPGTSMVDYLLRMA